MPVVLGDLEAVVSIFVALYFYVNIKLVNVSLLTGILFICSVFSLIIHLLMKKW